MDVGEPSGLAEAGGVAVGCPDDRWYLRHRSLVVDLAICLKTVSTFPSGSGAR